ncbi:MAG: hypothetical protein IM496_05110 [Microcystis sp. M049S2]|jgi:uncharacterized protein YciI|uniref:YciI family protein n=2 Tax=Microcystis TaxID=1125 RepID=UPI00258E452E|nr:YciI family protein [Microcystis sp. M049S2]MCA2657920.1 hypothetical protein [Microcystis sp. M049S2]
MPKFVIWSSYCENVLEKRAPYRQAHLEGLNLGKKRVIFINIGLRADLSQVFAIYQAASQSEVRELDDGGSVVIILSCKHRKNAYSRL